MDFDQLSNEERTWGMFCHLAAFLAFAFPFGNFVGVLLIWILKKNTSEFVNLAGKEAFNFQLLCSAIIFFCSLLWSIQWSAFIGVIIGILFLIYFVFEIILAAIATNQGKSYRYKYSLRLVK